MILVVQVLLYLNPNSRHDDTTMTAMGVGLARLAFSFGGQQCKVWVGCGWGRCSRRLSSGVVYFIYCCYCDENRLSCLQDMVFVQTKLYSKLSQD